MWSARVQEEKAGPKGGFHHYENLNDFAEYVKCSIFFLKIQIISLNMLNENDNALTIC